MPLLVSVRSGEEVAAALAGGAGIIDAKEPARGSLGAVEPEVLAAIAAGTPGSVPLSVALGDCTDREAVRAAVRAARIPPRQSVVYLKLGFAGADAEGRIVELLEAAVDEGWQARVVAVGYADHDAAGTIAPAAVLRAATRAGAAGLLVDTWRKDGRGLLDHLSLERLAALADGARQAGLLFAAAGSLDAESLPRVSAVAEVVGVRGAACRGGRDGRVDAERVAMLRGRLVGRPAPATLG